ncbi:MAG TPA: hypothetical protein VFH45_01765 [Acidimicrobiales bacterium]|nr:hypothetical protein [Acidimicrobiales bacterium]
MTRHLSRQRRRPRIAIGGTIAVAGFGLVLSACGSSGSSGAVSSGSSQTPAKSASSSSGSGSSGSSASNADVTFKTADVPGLGTVLVNGDGRTIYILTSEAGGKVTCTDANGCTKYWPDTELPSGMTQPVAGPGVDASKLGTTKGASGDLYSTYGGYPLYTFAGDSGPGQKNGQGIKSFGGVWEAMTPSGMPIAAAGAATSTTAPSSGGYGY